MISPQFASCLFQALHMHRRWQHCQQWTEHSNGSLCNLHMQENSVIQGLRLEAESNGNSAKKQQKNIQQLITWLLTMVNN